MKEYITLLEVFLAYYACRKHKRNKQSSLEYELNYEINNYELYKELNNMTYRPGKSIAFCITRPKLREVFAANFRDRIVHHLFIRKILPAIENRLSNHVYACRENKGVLCGVKDVLKMFAACRNGWYAKCDINGFFMSIDTEILLHLVNDIVKEACKKDVLWWSWLATLLVKHRPEKNCEIHGYKHLFKRLPDNKTLFKSKGKGLPIGNLTSQVFANLYLLDFDACMETLVLYYGRYADDFVLIDENLKNVLNAVYAARLYLAVFKELKLHQRKISILKVKRGICFIGTFIKNNLLFTGKRLINNALQINEKSNVVNSFNSYCGLLKHVHSYKIRRKMWRILKDHTNLIFINCCKIKCL